MKVIVFTGSRKSMKPGRDVRLHSWASSCAKASEDRSARPLVLVGRPILEEHFALIRINKATEFSERVTLGLLRVLR